MITAEEARKRIQKFSYTDFDEEEKTLAEDKIIEAASNDQNYCWLGVRAKNSTVKWLESLGYTVRIERITRTEKDADTRILW